MPGGTRMATVRVARAAGITEELPWPPTRVTVMPAAPVMPGIVVVLWPASSAIAAGVNLEAMEAAGADLVSHAVMCRSMSDFFLLASAAASALALALAKALALACFL